MTKVLQVKVVSNISGLTVLLGKALKQASALKTTIEELKGFQVEINTELVKSEKKEAAPDAAEKEKTIDNAQDAFNRLSQGHSTINQIRTEYGLKQIEEKCANELLVTKV